MPRTTRSSDSRSSGSRYGNRRHHLTSTHQVYHRSRRVSGDSRPAAAFRQRVTTGGGKVEDFSAPERWHPETDQQCVRYVTEQPGKGYAHPVTIDEIRERIAMLPARFTRALQVVQQSAMTRKRMIFPCYGMQWGNSVYLYPMEESLVEIHRTPPRPDQLIEARMYGGVWSQHRKEWRLTWTPKTIKDFYLNNVLIHEIGHLNDPRNTNSDDRERFANWFAIEFGYRATRNSGHRFSGTAARR
jgi:hypothetical protein